MLVWSQNNCCLFLPIYSFHGSGCTRCAFFFALHVPAKTAPTRIWLGLLVFKFQHDRRPLLVSPLVLDFKHFLHPLLNIASLLISSRSWKSSSAGQQRLSCGGVSTTSYVCPWSIVLYPKTPFVQLEFGHLFRFFSRQTPYYSCPKKVYTRASSLFDQSLICTMWSLRFFFVKHSVHHFIVIWFLRRHSIYLQQKISRK